MKVYVAGIQFDDKPWSLLGVFDTKEQAHDACTHWRHFYGECELNQRLRDDAPEPWPGFTFPIAAPPEPRSERFPDEHNCPRGAESGQVGESFWRTNDTCHYCGSLNPTLFLERLQADDVRIIPTDKDYKVYVEATGGESLGYAKFYFQHFSSKQQKQFIELLNAGRVKFGEPGHFYVDPFFIARKV